MSRNPQAHHLLIIPDGHRRYALDNEISYRDAYLLGARKVVELVDHLIRRPALEQVSVFLLACKNFEERKRSNLENILFAVKSCVTGLSELSSQRSFAIRSFGRKDRLPIDLREQLLALSANPPRFARRVNLLIDYSGLWELANLVTAQSWTVDRFLEATEFDPVDIVIRSGKAFRLSDAPVLATKQANMVLIPKLFPAVTTTDVDHALLQYEEEARERAEIKKGEPQK